MFVVYQNPLDYPGKFVVRGWTIGEGGRTYVDPSPAITSPEYNDVDMYRNKNHPNMVVLPREDQDDPAIREVWI